VLGGRSTSSLDVASRMNSRRTMNSLAGLGILAILGYYIYGFVSAESRLRRICATIPTGATRHFLADFAGKHGLKAPIGNAQVEYLVESRTFGRYGCKVILKGDVVQRAEYNYAD